MIIFKSFLIFLILFISVGSLSLKAQSSDKLKGLSYKVSEQKETIKITKARYVITIQKIGFRYEFGKPGGGVIASAHPRSGVQIGTGISSLSDVKNSQLLKQKNDPNDCLNLISIKFKQVII